MPIRTTGNPEPISPADPPPAVPGPRKPRPRREELFRLLVWPAGRQGEAVPRQEPPRNEPVDALLQTPVREAPRAPLSLRLAQRPATSDNQAGTDRAEPMDLAGGGLGINGGGHVSQSRTGPQPG